MKPSTKTRRDFLKTLGIGAAGLAIPGSTAFFNCNKSTENFTNFVIIFTDDQG